MSGERIRDGEPVPTLAQVDGCESDGWIPVSERLPEIGQKVDAWVLVDHPGGPTGFRKINASHWRLPSGQIVWPIAANAISPIRVTHWRPIPAAPKD